MTISKTEKMLGFVIIVIMIFSSPLFTQSTEIRPVTVGQPMPDFTLPIYQGGEVTLSQLNGKNIMLIFPRGLAGKDHWCHICNYQYAELSELEKELQLRKKYDLEIYFILPYGKEMIDDWFDKFPNQLTDIENWKNPPDPEKLNERMKNWMETAKRVFPRKFAYAKGEIPSHIPILIDAGRTVSKGLGLFTTEWNNAKIEQNIPTIYIIDKTGTLQFKYMSQNTLDRPGFSYLRKFLDRMIMQP